MNSLYFLCNPFHAFLCRELATDFNLSGASSAGCILLSPFLHLLGRLKSNGIVQQISGGLSYQLAEAAMTWKLGWKFPPPLDPVPWIFLDPPRLFEGPTSERGSTCRTYVEEYESKIVIRVEKMYLSARRNLYSHSEFFLKVGGRFPSAVWMDQRLWRCRA